MDIFSITATFIVLYVGSVSCQQQPGLINLLTTILTNNGRDSEFPPNDQQQQPGSDNLLTTLLSNNVAATALLQGPELASNLAGLLSYLNTTGNVTGVFNELSTDEEVSSLTTTLVTLLFESLSLTVLTNNRVSDACQKDMIVFIEELVRGTPWALRMLDATGKPGSDLSGGLTKFVGSYEECVGVHAVSYTSDVNGDERERGSFHGKYCSVTAELPGIPPQYLFYGSGYLQIGVCVPKTCSHTDVEILASIGNVNICDPLLQDFCPSIAYKRYKYSLAERLLFNNTVPLQPEAKCQELKTDVGADVIVVTGILSIIGCMVLIGTLYDVATMYFKYVADKDRQDKLGGHGVIRQNTTMEIERDLDLKRTDPEKSLSDKLHCAEDPGPTDKTLQKGAIEKAFLAFSVYTNGKKLLKIDQSGSLGAINGIRFLSQAWIILGHSSYYAKRYDANLAQAALQVSEDFHSMAISSGEVAVDTYFVLTGVMVTYLTLTKIQQLGSPKKVNWIHFYLHRYLRLTPLYMFVILIGTTILPYTMFGPFWDYNDVAYMEPCRKYWWTNLLYINNYVKVERKCLEWSWYLSNDMQFYWISPLLLVPFFYSLAAGLVICLSLLIAGAVTVGVIVHNHQYQSQRFSFQYVPLDEQALDGNEYKYIYNPSYARSGPFIVGVLAGYLLYRCKCKLRIPKLLNLAGWFLSIGITLAVVYGRYTNRDSHILSRLESDIFLALHKPAWGVAIGWIIVSCATGNGGWINTVLSWKPFTTFSRLTYCVYLIHPLVMVTFYSSRMATTYFTYYELIYLFLGHLTLSYGLAYVVSIVFESPWMALEKTFLKTA